MTVGQFQRHLNEFTTANAGAALTVDFSDPTHGFAQAIPLTAASCTLTFTAPRTHGYITLRFIQDATGGRAIVLPGSVVGTPPALNTAANAVTVYQLYYNGTSYYFVTAGPVSVNPLTKQFWVDGGAAASGNGSEVTPFQTVQQAIDAAGSNSVHIYIATGTYSGTITFPAVATAQQFNLHAGFSVNGQAVILSGAITANINQSLLFENIYVHGAITYTTGTLLGGYYLVFLACLCDAAITDVAGGALNIVATAPVQAPGFAYNPMVLSGVISAKGGLILEKCTVDNNVTCKYVQAKDTQFSLFGTPHTLTTTGTVDGTIGALFGFGCTFPAGWTYTGVSGKTVKLQDAATAINWDAAPPTLTNTTIVQYPDHLSMGVKPAGQGVVRLPNGGGGAATSGIFSRNNANSGDIQAYFADGADNLFFGDPTKQTTLQGSAVLLKAGSSIVLSLAGSTSDFIELGNAPATVGGLRLTHGALSSIVSGRDSGNANDVTLIDWGVTAANSLTLGSAVAPAVVNINYRASTEHKFLIGATTALKLDAGVMALGLADAQFALGLTPVINQVDNATAAATGAQTTIQAQNATGTGGTVGGKLLLASGTGATGGDVELGASSGNVVLTSSVQVKTSAPVLLFTGSSITLKLQDIATAAATGSLTTIHGQNATGTGATVGGKLVVASGTGATPGELQLLTGANSVLDAVPSTSITLGDGTTDIFYNANNLSSLNHRFQVSGFDAFSINLTGVICNKDTFQLNNAGATTMTRGTVGAATAASFAVNGQSTSNTGASAAGGDITMSGGSATLATTGVGGSVAIRGGQGSSSAHDGNVALCGFAPTSWQGMADGIFIANDGADPTGNPVGGGFLYVNAGALKYRGSSGTVTPLAAA